MLKLSLAAVIALKFRRGYRFADHKKRVIDLLARVTRVSIDTMALVAALKDAPR